MFSGLVRGCKGLGKLISFHLGVGTIVGPYSLELPWVNKGTCLFTAQVCKALKFEHWG